MAWLVRKGWQATFIICTNDNKGTHDRSLSPCVLAETRDTEQRHTAELLGVQCSSCATTMANWKQPPRSGSK
ncbi:MAG: hypothetical protein HC914_02480 [Chloroflexaceae bacterium]|nr:hypothetical protein [Chloroflexaceae bacterium]